MFVNQSKFAHVVVAGFNYRVNLADKAEIFVKNDAKITSGWSWRDVIAEDIYGKTLFYQDSTLTCFHTSSPGLRQASFEDCVLNYQNWMC